MRSLTFSLLVAAQCGFAKVDLISLLWLDLYIVPPFVFLLLQTMFTVNILVYINLPKNIKL